MSRRRRRLLIAALAALPAAVLALHLADRRRGPAGPPPAPAPEPAVEAAAEPAAPRTFTLAPGRPVEGRLAGGETHRFTLALAAGHFLELVVDQRGVDVVATLTAPAGDELLAVDSPVGDHGPETVQVVVETGGRHWLAVRAFAGQPAGDYQVRIEALRPAAGDDRRRAAATRRFHHGETLRRGREYRPAAEAYRAALATWQDLGDGRGQAEAYDRLGRVHGGLGEWRRSADFHQRALPFFRAAGEVRREAASEDLLGRALRALGDTDGALARYQRALALRREAGHRQGEAISLNSLGVVYRQRGEIQKALDTYRQALAKWREFGDHHSEATTLDNLGILHFYLGRDRRAFDFFAAAEELWSELDDLGAHGRTLDRMGQVQRRRGEPEKALGSHQRALELRSRAGDRRGQAVTLAAIALLREDRGEVREAADLLRRALEIFVELGDRTSEAHTRQALSRVLDSLDQPAAALGEVRQALELYREVRDPDGEADALAAAAGLERRRGGLEAARSHLESAFELYETLRRKTFSQELRAAYFATLQDRYSAYVDLLMELHGRQPGAGWDALALAASERTRARSLLEELERARGAATHLWAAGSSAELLERQHSLQERLNATERLRRERFAAGARATELGALDRRLRALADELSEVRALSAGRPHPGAVDGGEPLTVPAIRRRVLDDDTLLLVVELGPERSFLWLLGRSRLQSFELPPRAEVESAARDAYRFLVRSQWPESRVAARRALCRLGAMVLQPIAGELGSERLAVVAEGALAYVPFAALPDPRTGDCAAAPPLIVAHEIVHLPSASILAALRREVGRRPPPAGTVAVVADPVFEASDPRVSRVEAPALAAAPPTAGAFRRLPHTRREAAAVVALAGGNHFQALDFAASKEMALAGGLAGYRVVHFATHGVVDSEHPELSSLVLSLVDERGRPRDGRLRLHEIYNLELPADLVVLSACRTALGRQVRGEGLIGLTRAFMNAGAARLIVSLWDVGDPSTAELMDRFYRQHFDAGLPPAAALRQAQIALWRQERWRAPYHWAGFVIQGEWR